MHRPVHDERLVRSEYADESRLQTRFRAMFEWHDVDLHARILEHVAAGRPERVLEIGCGAGEFSELMMAELGARVSAIDQSERMVELARERGVLAEVGDAQALHYADSSFDCVVANWMLYHLPELDRGLTEIQRVLTPGGRLVATTFSARNMPELWSLFDDPAAWMQLSFTSENGEQILREHFADVDQHDIPGTIRFPTRDAVVDHVAATLTRGHFAEQLPSDLPEPFEVSTLTSVFLAGGAVPLAGGPLPAGRESA